MQLMKLTSKIQKLETLIIFNLGKGAKYQTKGFTLCLTLSSVMYILMNNLSF